MQKILLKALRQQIKTESVLAIARRSGMTRSYLYMLLAETRSLDTLGLGPATRLASALGITLIARKNIPKKTVNHG